MPRHFPQLVVRDGKVIEQRKVKLSRAELVFYLVGVGFSLLNVLVAAVLFTRNQWLPAGLLAADGVAWLWIFERWAVKKVSK